MGWLTRAAERLIVGKAPERQQDIAAVARAIGDARLTHAHTLVRHEHRRTRRKPNLA